MRVAITWTAVLALVAFTGCRHTAEGVKADTKRVLEKTGQGLEKAGQGVEKAGQKLQDGK